MTRRVAWAWLVVAVAMSAAGCSREKPKGESKTCSPECLPWEECRDGVCFSEPLEYGDPLAITPDGLPNGRVGVRYEQALTVVGAPNGLSFEIVSGDLPDGLTFDPAGLVAGVPAFEGSFSFNIAATAGERSGERSFTVVIDPVALDFRGSQLPGTEVGAVYRALLRATGGTAPLRYQVIGGDRPDGLSLSEDGVLTGVPQAAGIYRTQITVTDSSMVPQTVAAWFGLTVLPRLQVLPETLPWATEGTPYVVRLEPSGCFFLGCSLERVLGALPSGLTLTAEGLLSGTPRQNGLFPLTVRVIEPISGRESDQEYELKVTAVPLKLPAQQLPEAMVGHGFEAELAVDSGTPPYDFHLLAGVLPAGVALTADGKLAGVPLEAGLFGFQVRVSDSASPAQNAVARLELRVLDELLLAADALPEGVVGRAYRAALSASGGELPLVFGIQSGALPPGLTLGQDGTLSGTPEVDGVFDFVAQVLDAAGQLATQAFSVTVQSKLVLVTQSLPMGTLGNPYAAALEARGGVPPYSFRLVAGTALPAGLALAGGGELSGTPLVAGTSMLVVEVLDSGSAPQSATGELALAISPDGVEAPLAIVTPSLPPAALGQSYRATIDVTGGSRPYYLSLAFGSVLPAGLVLSSSGAITGTPLHAGTYRILVQADDSSNPAQVALRGYTLVVAPASGDPLELLTQWLPDGDVGVPYRAALEAQGGQPPYRFGISAASRLPSGLYVDASGMLQGTPLAAGRFIFTAAVWDASAPYQMATATLSLTIGSTVPGEAVLVLTGAMRKAKVNVPYEATLNATGGSGSYRWRVAWGMLPPGLALSDRGGIVGTPSAQGTFAFAVEVQDASSLVASQANLSIFVLATGAAGVRVITPGFPDAEIGVPYDRGLMAIGGQAPYDFALTGEPPALGLVVDQSHRASLAGVAEVSGLFRMLVTATDSSGASGLYYEHMAVQPLASGLLFSTSMLPDGMVGLPYALTLGASGGTAPYHFELSRGTALPPQLTLSPDGVLAGVPQSAGDWTVIVRVVDATGASAEAQFWMQLLE